MFLRILPLTVWHYYYLMLKLSEPKSVSKHRKSLENSFTVEERFKATYGLLITSPHAVYGDGGWYMTIDGADTFSLIKYLQLSKAQ